MYQGKIHHHVTKVEYRDLDMYSVVYHPKYFEILDSARNQAFQDYGYPVEEQLRDKVGFTVAAIEGVTFSRPMFMGEEISVFTEVTEVSKKSCKVLHWITLGTIPPDFSDPEKKYSSAIFKACYTLVFVSIEAITEYPLNKDNIFGLKTLPFNEKVKSSLGF